MNSQKTPRNIHHFEKSISNSILSLLAIALIITTTLFITIAYQSHLQEKSKNSETINRVVRLLFHNLSEKLSIIASSDIFFDFLTSGSSTRNDLEKKFLTELLPLHSSGIIGFSLTNLDSGTNYESGDKSSQFTTVKLCYLLNKLDIENGNCYGILKLFFSENHIINELTRLDSNVIPCNNCTPYNLKENNFFGNYLIADQSNISIGLTTKPKSERILYYYLIIILVLIVFAIFNRSKIRKLIKKTISIPLDLLVQNIKARAPMEKIQEGLSEINYLATQIEEGRHYEKQAAIGLLAAGVAHDIRSPLAVMEITMSKIASSIAHTEISILKQAVQSVRDIANNLLEQHRHVTSAANPNLVTNTQIISEDDGNISRPILLSFLLEIVISQKKYEWQNNPCELDLFIELNAKFLWVHAAPNDIKRVFSNLLNNAYEALLNTRTILVSMFVEGRNLIVKIEDSGQGIKPEKLNSVLSGNSLKHAGSGYGLSSAKRIIEGLEGSLSLSSTYLQGTQVTLCFPVAPSPACCANTINLNQDSIVVILDDDMAIHNFWVQRLRPIGLKSKHFINSTSFFSWYETNNTIHNELTYIIDYELRNETTNGLEITSRINHTKNIYLATNHFNEIKIQIHCKDLSIGLIPKPMLDEIQVHIN